jgi:ATPase subunit of ABC transporter with duplicated ATPase domains
MQSLQLNKIYYKYASSPNYLFENLSLEFYQGWYGLVGANGAGKTTLLKLITKELSPESGTIRNDLVTAYCPQSTEYLTENIEDFFNSYTSETFKLKELLGIQEEWFYQWGSLSHGERKRIQIAAALFSHPDILIVDEPTNHLDTQSKEKLFSALEGYKGIGILVSHDRELLDLLCKETLLLQKGSITRIKSNFSTAKEELQSINNFQKEQKQQHEKRVKKLDRQIQTAKENVSRSKGRLSMKHIDTKDSDAKAKIYLAKITSKNKGEGQAVKTALSKKEQLLQNDVIIDKEYPSGIFFQQLVDTRVFPFVIEENRHTIHQFELIIPRLVIEQGDRIWIQGNNGSGKTTFIHYLLSTLKPKDYLFIPQEISEEESKNIFTEILNLSHEQQGAIFTTVTRLSSDPKALLQSKIPSPGEIRKLLLAKDLAKCPPMIILDEPTNHMDLDSIISIEEALKAFDGAVVFISHDKAFCKNLVNRIWEVKKAKYTIKIESKG